MKVCRLNFLYFLGKERKNYQGKLCNAVMREVVEFHQGLLSEEDNLRIDFCMFNCQVLRDLESKGRRNFAYAAQY